MIKKLILLGCVILFSGMLFIGLSLKKLGEPNQIDEPPVIEVLYGDSISTVAKKLNSMGLLSFPSHLTLFARLTGLANQIKAGEYQINDQDSALAILDKIVKGKVKRYQLTLIEGWTASQALKAVQQSEGIITTLDEKDLLNLLHSLDGLDRFSSVEGFIFPSTYHYHRGSKDADIILRAMQQMQMTLKNAWSERQPNLPFDSVYEALILASIVEKETGLRSERTQIAGVFTQRLRKGMRLQSDPTVIYGMGKNYNGNISVRDLKNKTAFNTYQIKALPPTPIALPGKEAIEATLNPLENGMLYFVAKGDGSHAFSSNINDHNRAVRRYQINRTEPYRSSPQ